MNQELSLELQEKNLEILKNKFKLDISNNMNSLVLSLNHILDFEVSRALMQFITIYDDASIEFSRDDALDILVLIGRKYLENMKVYLKKKRSDMFIKVDSITYPFGLDTLYAIVSLDDDNFFTLLKDDLNEFIGSKISPSLLKITKVDKTSFAFNRSISFLTDSFVKRIIDKTSEQITIRNQTLTNNAKSNYDHYTSLPSSL